LGDVSGKGGWGERVLWGGVVEVFVGVGDIVFDSGGLVVFGLKPKFEAGEELVYFHRKLKAAAMIKKGTSFSAKREMSKWRRGDKDLGWKLYFLYMFIKFNEYLLLIFTIRKRLSRGSFEAKM